MHFARVLETSQLTPDVLSPIFGRPLPESLVAKAFLQWMASGLGGIVAAALVYYQSGAVLTLNSVLSFVGAALAVRAANWVIATLGPKPTA